ncbi:zinc finger protein ZFPM1 [Tamandua tetradactyla]|uniref:zinc finger protein ZFPM1 n=1 Tax=Tamandua tetradactyla TaxID=48850 RepID=UPI00405426F3
MSRRKQSNPRQIKRSLGDMEAREETPAVDTGVPEEVVAPEPETAGGPAPMSPPSRDTEQHPLPPPTPPGDPKEMGEQEPETRPEEETGSSWRGPDELEPALQAGRAAVRARSSLPEGQCWGPFPGRVQSRTTSPGKTELSPALTLLLEDEACWLRSLPQAPTDAEANSVVYRKDDALWCRTTKPVPAGGLLSVLLTAEPPSPPNHAGKRELGAPECPAPVPTDIQLLPQQAGMASILATAVVNKDVFPCKDCGIWYRSERNLQAHLLYYCASRQSTGSPATVAADEKPKETYPNERICPFPQCRKSCPSASSLEIHMRSHSGERPFVCLICLSAFTTKANCERHLKVHTDTLSGVCHSCGFISTTRDILYSHLVTNHMICQPGSKGEIYSTGPGHPGAKPHPDTLASFQQLAALHCPLASVDQAHTPPAGTDRKPVIEATNGEAGEAPQNGGGSSEPPAAIKVEAAGEAEAGVPGEPSPGRQAPSRTPSPRSPATARVKAELPSPPAGASPGPGPPGALFLPQFALGPDAATALPPASEILAKMSELVHSRLRQGPSAAGAPAGATCFECEITFSNVSNFYVHKRLYCSGRRAPDDAAPARRPRAPPASPGPRDDEPRAATPEPEAAASEGSPSPGSSLDDAEDDPSRTLCEACNIRFSRHETYSVHKRYYCASRHDPPPRRTAPAAPTRPAPAAPVRTRRRRRLYELHAAGHAPPPPAEPPASPRPGSRSGAAPSPGPAAANDGPIDLSKKPRRQGPEGAPAGPAPGLPALADYHECTACRVSFHSLEAYLAHKKYSCPATALRPGALEQLRGLRGPPDPDAEAALALAPAAAVVCPYCPPNGVVRGDLLEHFRLAHGLLVGKPPAGPGAAEARTPADRAPPPTSPSSSSSPQPAPRTPRDSLHGQELQELPPAPANGSPPPSLPPSPAAAPARCLSPVPDALLPPPPTPPSYSDKGVQTPSKGTPGAVPNGNHRYCRLCNIKFSSLSTFIAHKKYYCSSHAAEHVK